MPDHERPLAEAMQRQQHYQDSMHNVTTRMEKLQRRLDTPDRTIDDLESQARENQVCVCQKLDLLDICMLK